MLLAWTFLLVLRVVVFAVVVSGVIVVRRSFTAHVLPAMRCSCKHGIPSHVAHQQVDSAPR